MNDSIWDSTLAQFRDRLSSLESVPAGVSTSAASAVFALGLLAKVLKIASKRKDFLGDRALADELIDQAHGQSEILATCADQDIIAYRQRSPDIIEIPLKTARAAAYGLELCRKARALVHRAVMPDLDAAATLLAGAARATLYSLEANLEQLPSQDLHRNAVTIAARELLRLIDTATLPSPRFREDR